jgi:hypothetical protein
MRSRTSNPGFLFQYFAAFLNAVKEEIRKMKGKGNPGCAILFFPLAMLVCVLVSYPLLAGRKPDLTGQMLPAQNGKFYVVGSYPDQMEGALLFDLPAEATNFRTQWLQETKGGRHYVNTEFSPCDFEYSYQAGGSSYNGVYRGCSVYEGRKMEITMVIGVPAGKTPELPKTQPVVKEISMVNIMERILSNLFTSP